MMLIIEYFELLETTKIIQMMFVVKHCCQGYCLLQMLLEMFSLEDVSTKGCCYQRTANVDTKNIVAKGHYYTPKLLLYKKLLPN